MTKVRPRWAIAIGILSASVLLASYARADGPFEGTWRTSAMRIEVSVESWGGDCGPRPQSTTVAGGANVQVLQSGDDLTFRGRRPRSTNGCWSENAHVQRVSRTYESGTWRIVCRTPEDDPRAETGRYTLSASGTNQIAFRDVSQYDWTLNESRCVATITSTQTFTRVSDASEVAETTPTPEETGGSTQASPGRCARPGRATRLVVRPASADVQPGEQICFTSRVVDANGCGLRRTVRFSSSAGEVDDQCLTVPASMSSGEVQLTAQSGNLSARAVVSVRELDFTDLIARRTEAGGAVAVDDAEIDGAVARVAAHEEEAGSSLGLWLGLGLLALLVAAVAAFVLIGRRRPPSAAEGDPPPPRRMTAPPPDVAASTLPPLEELGQKICPRCRRGYPPSATTCANDGSGLVLYADFVASTGTKVCPQCGERYPATRSFCGKDGTTLVDASAESAAPGG